MNLKWLFLSVLIALGGCAGINAVLPESELKNYSTKKIFELGADRYKEYDNEGAMYYYSNIIKLYPEDLDAVAWAKYEIGYINYMEKRYDAATEMFDLVLQIKSPSQSAQVLAVQMKDKIQTLLSK